MSPFAFLKIPYILLAMLGLHTTVTAPKNTSSNAAAEIGKCTLFERILRSHLRQVVEAICWIAAISEIAVIVASQSPEYRLSKFVLDRLLWTRAAADFQPSTGFYVGTALAALGGFIRFCCYQKLGSLFNFSPSIEGDHKLVTDGPYAVVRHPGYTGAVTAIVGIACWNASPGSWTRESGVLNTMLGQTAVVTYIAIVGTFVVGLMRRVPQEDTALQKRFGKEWEEWASRTRYRLLPLVF